MKLKKFKDFKFKNKRGKIKIKRISGKGLYKWTPSYNQNSPNTGYQVEIK